MIEFKFHQEDTVKAKIYATDLLFVDTFHNAFQLTSELAENHYAVFKFMIFHDTDTYGIKGEGDAPGLWECIIAFLMAHRDWKLLEHRPESNGLTVLQRI